ncbi:ATP-dependent DNA helicase PIF1-like [Aphis craccivora]|uniref:ATP-dependent DNA helicase PIF1-like n=1 Tax=Aphis craccivora TaxID=307492 RepID=A0A6G0VUK7_APHCR|nr:ATP-dependent DNA helicase PIF1-like [Aphis craccivora]
MPPMRRTNIGRRTRNARNINEFRRAHNTPQIRQHVNIRRRSSDVALNRAAFEYDSAVAYNDLMCVDIGSLYIVCQHCKALKFRLETPGLCCSGGTVKLSVLAQPPEPLYSLLYGNTISRQLLALGNGHIPIDVLTGLISFPANFCEFTSSKEELITKVFPSIEVNYNNLDWISEREILAARNKEVDSLNFSIQSKIAGELRSYKSVDSTTDENEAVNYPTEFLNSLDVQGTPPHNLQVKVGSIIIMLRNLNPPKLCNGARLNNVIQSTIIKGNFKGEEVLIPRIPIIPTDLPFQFKRIQFPVRLAFAMTINKSQGQSLEVCGINLEFPCFSHGQLYVTSSRVGKPSSLFIFATENKTKNIVYKNALN